jgi:phosphatidylserine decarboxylase
MVVYLLLGMLFLPVWIIVIGEAVLAAVLVLVVSFFRDPHRLPPADTNVLLAPADGQVTDIEVIEEGDYIGSEALRIGIFMSIFNVHINRAPGNARVAKITHKPGRYIIANNARAGRVNESNDLALVRTDEPKDRLVVRQISGAVARRIVCTAKEGQELTGGEKFGMIKFGSRAELIVGVRDNVKCLVQVGDKVKAGLSPLLRYEQ